jgi:beta-galactosidase
MWRIPYEPGMLKAVSRTDGKVVLEKEVRTAEQPHKIVLVSDRSLIKADGQDLSFVTAKIVDKNGTLVPDADNLVTFELMGPARIAGVDNGSQISHEPFKANHRKAFKGMCLAIVQSTNRGGKIILKATSFGLTPAAVGIGATR